MFDKVGHNNNLTINVREYMLCVLNVKIRDFTSLIQLFSKKNSGGGVVALGCVPKAVPNELVSKLPCFKQRNISISGAEYRGRVGNPARRLMLRDESAVAVKTRKSRPPLPV